MGGLSGRENRGGGGGALGGVGEVGGGRHGTRKRTAAAKMTQSMAVIPEFDY